MAPVFWGEYSETSINEREKSVSGWITTYVIANINSLDKTRKSMSKLNNIGRLKKIKGGERYKKPGQKKTNDKNEYPYWSTWLRKNVPYTVSNTGLTG